MAYFVIDDYGYTTISGSSNSVSVKAIDKNKTSYSNIPDTITYGGETFKIDDLGECFKDCINMVTPPTLPTNISGTMMECFSGCSSLESSPTIPRGTNSMNACFYGCIKLENAPILIPNTVEDMQACFCNCQSLTAPPEIAIGVTLMSNCFDNCTSLTQAPDIPYTVVDMIGCFRNCTALTSPPGIPSQGRVASMSECFLNCAALTEAPNIPSSVTNLSYCFRNCDSLTEAPTIPSSVINMEWCFSGCTSLSVASVIPANVTSIARCFKGCTSLVLPPNLNAAISLENMQYCFQGCTALTAPPSIPNTVKNMGYCFSGCVSLGRAPAIPNGVSDMRYCFADCILLTQPPTLPSSVRYLIHCFDGCELLDLPENYIIPTSILSLGHCFSGCRSLSIPPVFTNLMIDLYDMECCFYGCFSLQTAPPIPHNVMSLSACFYDCQSLTEPPFEIPSSVTSMYQCFGYCDSLTEPPDLSSASNLHNMSYCFEGCRSLQIAPIIPFGVTTMDECFSGCSSLVSPPTFTDEHIIESLWRCFADCHSLTSAPMIPSSVTNMYECFGHCESLIGTMVVKNNPTNYQYIFYEAVADNLLIDIYDGASQEAKNTWISIAAQYPKVHIDPVPTCTVTVTSSGSYYAGTSTYSVNITNADAYDASITNITLTVGDQTASRSNNGSLSVVVPTTSGSYTPTVVISNDRYDSTTYELTNITVRSNTKPTFTSNLTSRGPYYAGVTPITVSITNATAYEDKQIVKSTLTVNNQKVEGPGNGTLSIVPSVAGNPNISVTVVDNMGSVALPQGFITENVRPNTIPTCTITDVSEQVAYYTDATPYTIDISNAKAYEGKAVSNIVFTIGSQSIARTNNGTLTITPSQVGTFTPTVTITDNIGATNTYTLAPITVRPLVADISFLKVERIDGDTDKISDEGTSALVTATFNYSVFQSTTGNNYLLNPDFLVNGDNTYYITWYTNWTNSDGFSGPVDWTNYHPNSPVRLYGKAHVFNTDQTYILSVNCKSTYKTSQMVEINLPQAFYLLAGKAGGHALGIGKKPVTDNTLDIGMKRTIFNDSSEGDPVLAYKGSKSQTDMIKFKDNTTDENGNGIVIGGGGLVVIGSGESADSVANTHSSGGDEILDLTSDGDVNIWTNAQGGATNANTRKSTFKTNGILKVPGGYNGLLTGTGTAASDKGSGVSPRYFPAKWTFDAEITPTNGDAIIFKIPVAGHDYGVFLSTNNGTNYYPVILNGTSRLTTHYGNGLILTTVFEASASAASICPVAGGDSRTIVTGGCWRIVNFYDANTSTSCKVDTGAGTAAKSGWINDFSLKNPCYLQVLIRYANTYAGAITLNVNNTGAKPIYINGSASSNSNYTLPAGTYFVKYNGTYYDFRTNDRIPANITGVADGNGKIIVQASEPTGNSKDLWIDPTTGMAKYYYDGAWRQVKSFWG